METTTLASKTGAVEEPRHLCNVATPADRLADQQECNHFSLRGFVALLQKKDPKHCSLQIYGDKQQYDEHHNSSPLSVAKYRQWDCTNCLDKLKTSGHRTTSETNFMQQYQTDGCSISIVRTLHKSVDSRRLFYCTPKSSKGNDANRSIISNSSQECASAFGNKAISAANAPATLAEENVQGIFVEKSVPATKDFQGSPNNLDVSANILNDVSMDVSDLPDVLQMISSVEANDTESPCSPKPCVVANEDENRTTQDIPNNDHNESTRNRHKDSKHISGHRSNLIHKQGPCQASLRRSVRSDSKRKNNKLTSLADIPDIKFYQRKPKKMRLLSELIGTDQVGGSKDASEVDYENTIDIHQSGKSKMSIEVGKDDDTPIIIKKVGEIQSKSVRNKAKHTGADNIDDGSPLIDWQKETQKKVRIEKKDSGHMYLGFSAVSNSNLDAVASNEMHHDFVPSVRDLGQENVPSTIIADAGNEKAHNDNTEQNMLKANDMCRNESENLEQRFSSNGNSMILIKRKVLPTAVAHGENTENEKAQNDNMEQSMLRVDGSPRMEYEGIDHICQTKDGPIDTSTVLDCNFQKSLASEGKQKALQVHASPRTEAAYVHPQDLHKQKSSQCPAESRTQDPNSHPTESHTQNSFQEPRTHFHKEEEVTIVFASPIFLNHQHSPEEPAQSRSNQGEKKLMCDSFKAASRNSPTSTYGFRFRNIPREVDSVPIHMYGASRNHVQLSSVPSTSLTMEVGRPDDQRIAGQSGLYGREPVTANYQRADRRQMVLQTQTLGPQYMQHDQFNASPNTSYGGHLIEKVPLTLQDSSRHQVQLNVHRPLRPHPRVGVFGPLLQQDIANWSANYGAQSRYRLCVSKGTTSFAIYRKGNHETLNSGMFSAGWNALQLGSVSSVDPELDRASYGSHQIEKAPLMLQGLSWRQVQQNLYRPLRPHPRVGMFGPLLQQDIARWSSNRGTQSGTLDRD
ncbi:hypothetical protein BS78_08G044500 [Paspalum vaginatum]|nr:hypothetical protein BS78_08G044500 [Paspalum vaginatum]